MQERMRSRNFFEYTRPRFKPLTVTDFWPCVLEYCALSDYLSNDIEHVQKRALSIISPGLSHLNNLSLFKLNSQKDRRIIE